MVDVKWKPEGEAKVASSSLPQRNAFVATGAPCARALVKGIQVDREDWPNPKVETDPNCQWTSGDQHNEKVREEENADTQNQRTQRRREATEVATER